MTLSIISFTRRGAHTALSIAEAVGGESWAMAKYALPGQKVIAPSLSGWTEKHFATSSGLIFVSACGIAVRAIAPYVRDKRTDPAVVCMDDEGHNVIPLLSGHLGGANDLARRLAEITGGNAVITTATDVHNETAIDEWAKKHNCAIGNMHAAKEISAAVLDGRQIGVAVTGEDIPAPWPVTLFLRPKNLVLGVGCKKNMTTGRLKDACATFLEGAGVSPLSVCALASISLKRNEQGIIDLAHSLSAPFVTYTAEELAAVEGRFSESEKVKSVTGVGCVCERAAVKCALGGPLLRSKTIFPGITFALARLKSTDAMDVLKEAHPQ